MEGYHKHSNGGGWVRDGLVVDKRAYIGAFATIEGGTIYGGTIRGSTIEGGTIWDGTIYGGTIYGGTIYDGTIYDGTIYDGTIYGGTIYGGTIYGGTIRGSTIRGGTIYDGTIIHGGTILAGIVRSDHYYLLGQTDAGYPVSANLLDGSWRIEAGCRDFSIDEAIAHWSSPDYHTPSSGRRIVAALRWLADEPIPT